ncbi:MAG: hypothetical protein QGH82_03505 [Candidatus Woesearchaeota archaeon]|nr:hypothetical protein [Candidatus Woesearchaeota archaeon]
MENRNGSRDSKLNSCRSITIEEWLKGSSTKNDVIEPKSVAMPGLHILQARLKSLRLKKIRLAKRSLLPCLRHPFTNKRKPVLPEITEVLFRRNQLTLVVLKGKDVGESRSPKKNRG